MVPRLLECGIGGFQGFQYEDGMDYEKICKMKTRDGSDLFVRLVIRSNWGNPQHTELMDFRLQQSSSP